MKLLWFTDRPNIHYCWRCNSTHRMTMVICSSDPPGVCNIQCLECGAALGRALISRPSPPGRRSA